MIVLFVSSLIVVTLSYKYETLNHTLTKNQTTFTYDINKKTNFFSIILEDTTDFVNVKINDIDLPEIIIYNENVNFLKKYLALYDHPNSHFRLTITMLPECTKKIFLNLQLLSMTSVQNNVAVARKEVTIHPKEKKNFHIFQNVTFLSLNVLMRDVGEGLQLEVVNSNDDSVIFFDNKVSESNYSVVLGAISSFNDVFVRVSSIGSKPVAYKMNLLFTIRIPVITIEELDVSVKPGKDISFEINRFATGVFWAFDNNFLPPRVTLYRNDNVTSVLYSSVDELFIKKYRHRLPPRYVGRNATLKLENIFAKKVNVRGRIVQSNYDDFFVSSSVMKILKGGESYFVNFFPEIEYLNVLFGSNGTVAYEVYQNDLENRNQIFYRKGINSTYEASQLTFYDDYYVKVRNEDTSLKVFNMEYVIRIDGFQIVPSNLILNIIVAVSTTTLSLIIVIGISILICIFSPKVRKRKEKSQKKGWVQIND